MVTFFENIYTDKPYYITLMRAVERIKTGRSKEKVISIQQELTKEKREALKKTLPAVLFSGEFKGRKDDDLIKHSGFVILDFDEVMTKLLIEELKNNQYTHAAWVSPSGNGVKALIQIADPKRHRDHLKAIFKAFPLADPVNLNEARVCFESYDPDIYINPSAKIWTEFIQTEIYQTKNNQTNKNETFNRLIKWLVNSGSAFHEGERNIYIFKLACACCRFGIDESETVNLISSEYLTKDGEFNRREAERTIKSAYRTNISKFNSAKFENEKAITTITKKEIDPATFDLSQRPKDVIYGLDVVDDALKIYDIGYKFAQTTHIPLLDAHWKFRRGEITLLSGIGNFGKTEFLRQLLLIKSVKDKMKWATFSPENFPAHEYYHDCVESLLGADCCAYNREKPSREKYFEAYKKISEHFFFVYPKKDMPTPEIIRERFLELVIKEKVDGVVIDPFNQLSNKWGDRDDKYLETFLSDMGRFARETNIFLFIINHPKQLRKDGAKNYPCPDVFDLANGAMWNNKADNILIYHRPNYSSDPTDTTCEVHIKKIRRQKIVGLPGIISFHYDRKSRRYYFNGENPLEEKQVQLKNFYETEKDDMPFTSD